MHPAPNDSTKLHYRLHVRQYTLLQKWALAIWTTQLLTLFFAGAMNDGRVSFLYTSPAVAIPGFAFALVTWPLRSWRVLAYGLSAPLVTAGTAAVIAIFRLDPDDAQNLTSIMLNVYVLAAAPLAIATWQQILRRPAARRTWQYSVKSLLRLMTTLALLLVLARSTIALVTGGSDRAFFASLAAINLVLCGVFVYWFAVQSRRSDVSSGGL